ncbi:hypothetical protein ILUMI_25088 [Ignelater luminosus]|uniref:Cathepsin L n=1 Tax=Ignelater luminosus TaxID=2038154 RepID=A0A8K0G007_IGNLU|nr:hypothetical protein ILUMI_25088 [Ignelater luminosus]
MKVFIVLVATLVGIHAISFLDVFSHVLVQEQWETFKLRHHKQYKSPSEEEFRMKVFMDNMHKIQLHNQKYEMGFANYMLKMNQFGDMLNHEFIHIMNGFNKTKYPGNNILPRTNKNDGITFMPPANVKLPESVDWREKGAVTPVKNQGNCGSCWSFSATGSLEGQHFRKTGKLISLSEQNLIDCSTDYGNNGCAGGLMDYSFRYIKDNHGLDTETSYPYEAIDDKCRYNPKNSGATDRGYTDIKAGDEEQLKAAVATVGPISVAIDAGHDSFQFYSEGVYDEPQCNSLALDHGVLAVGYGTTEDGVDYWLVKNSWGTTWGDKGYILMSRNKDNQCGIATQASFPIV